MKSFILFCLLIFSSNSYANDCYESKAVFGNLLESFRWSHLSPSLDIYNAKCASNMPFYELATDTKGMYKTLLQDIDKINSGMASLEDAKRALDTEKQHWLEVKHGCGVDSEVVARIEKITEEGKVINGKFTILYRECKEQLLHSEKLLLELIANGGNGDFAEGEYSGFSRSGVRCGVKIDQDKMVIYEPGTTKKMKTVNLDAYKISDSHVQSFLTDSGRYHIRFKLNKAGRSVPTQMFHEKFKEIGSDIHQDTCELTRL